MDLSSGSGSWSPSASALSRRRPSPSRRSRARSSRRRSSSTRSGAGATSSISVTRPRVPSRRTRAIPSSPDARPSGTSRPTAAGWRPTSGARSRPCKSRWARSSAARSAGRWTPRPLSSGATRSPTRSTSPSASARPSARSRGGPFARCSRPLRPAGATRSSSHTTSTSRKRPASGQSGRAKPMSSGLSPTAARVRRRGLDRGVDAAGRDGRAGARGRAAQLGRAGPNRMGLRLRTKFLAFPAIFLSSRVVLTLAATRGAQIRQPACSSAFSERDLAKNPKRTLLFDRLTRNHAALLRPRVRRPDGSTKGPCTSRPAPARQCPGGVLRDMTALAKYPLTAEEVSWSRRPGREISRATSETSAPGAIERGDGELRARRGEFMRMANCGLRRGEPGFHAPHGGVPPRCGRPIADVRGRGEQEARPYRHAGPGRAPCERRPIPPAGARTDHAPARSSARDGPRAARRRLRDPRAAPLGRRGRRARRRIQCDARRDPEAGHRAARGPRAGRGRRAGQGRVPRHDEPRDPHPDERRDRHDRSPARHGSRAPTSASTPRRSRAPRMPSSRILNDILDFSKIEAGRLELETHRLRPSVGASQDVAELLAERARARARAARARWTRRVPDAVRGDPGRLRQVLTNLIGNAVKFTEHGEVVVSVHVADERADALTRRVESATPASGFRSMARSRSFKAFSRPTARPRAATAAPVSGSPSAGASSR